MKRPSQSVLIRLEFSRRLKHARTQKYSSAKLFADKIGIAWETYRRYERGETEPSLKTLGDMADELDVSTDYLVPKRPRPTRRKEIENSDPA